MKLYYKYNPMPSVELSRRGEVLLDSHFLAQGMLYFDDGDSISCEFEIAHMKDGNSWAVVYIEPDQSKNILDKARLYQQIEFHPNRIEGIEKIYGYKIKAETLSWRSHQGWLTDANGIQIIFWIGRYKVVFDEKESSTIHFFIPNLFLYSNQYSPKDNFDLQSKARKNAVAGAIAQSIELSKKDKEETEIIEIATEAANSIADEILNSDFVMDWKHISIEIDDKELARLYWQKNSGDITYTSECSARLIIFADRLPENWDVEIIAEWICNLFSMSLGKVIRWNYYHSDPENPNMLSAIKVWKSRKISENKFYAFTSEKGHYRERVGIDATDGSISLVKSVLATILQHTSKEMDTYLNTLSSYIDYISAPASSYEFQCTLICALGEHIYGIWEELTTTEIQAKMFKTSRKKILDIVQKATQEQIQDILPQRPLENDNLYKIRYGRFLNDLRSNVSKNLKGNLKDELKWLFISNGWDVANDYGGNIMGERIVQFVETRNKLFHEHRFVHEKDNPELGSEIINVQMFIPILLSVVLGFKGRLWDRYTDNWGWIVHE